MTKFSGKQDDGYMSVSSVLWRWATELEGTPAPAPAESNATAAEATRQRWASPTHGGVYTQGGNTYSGQNYVSGGELHQGNIMNIR